jgi:hypothetical protein
VYGCVYTAKAADIAEYIGQEFKHSADLVKGIETLSEPIIPEPEDLPDDATAPEKRKWEKRIDKIIEQEDCLKDTTSCEYALVWGQCSDALRERVKAHKDYQKA